MEAEYYALAEALRVASVESDGDAYCEAYSDCQPLVDKMNGDERRQDDWAEYFKSCQWLFGKFDGHELNYRSREHNEDAHELARTALQRGRQSPKS